MRRYFAGHTLLADFLIEEAEQDDLLRGAPLQRLLRTQATLLDRLLAAVSEEHARESEERPFSVEERRAQKVEQLLDAELIDTSELSYDFEGHHLGAIASGLGAQEAFKEIATSLDRRLLWVRHSEGTVWAWLGGRRRLDPKELVERVSSTWPPKLFLALGEQAQGLAGWRLTHRQAKAALPIALRGQEAVTRYADVALIASMLQDDLLAESLRELYLRPLEAERDGGEAARETLRAYFAAGRNVTAAAALLGVSRRTISNRIYAIEERLSLSLAAIVGEIEAALRLDELSDADSTRVANRAIQPDTTSHIGKTPTAHGGESGL